MRAHSDLPVSFTDPQGPLNIALCLCGLQNLCIWMYEYPSYVHEIMEFCTEAFIQWIQAQKKHMGENNGIGAFPHGIALPGEFGGVWLSDDDCTVLSPDLYKEFVVPYNSKIFKAFNGGTLHFCGTAQHQIDNLLHTEGLVGVNNFCMGNFKQIHEMKEAFKDRIALMVCDFTPLHIEDYYTHLIEELQQKGTILATFIAPEFALLEGKYDIILRDRQDISAKSYKTIKQLTKCKFDKR